MTEEIINLKDYFVHHYDDWGRLYCVEFKGSPLDLENSIKRLEQENKELKAYKDINEDFKQAWNELNEKDKQLRSALEEIRGINKWFFDMNYGFDEQGISYDVKEVAREIQNKINEGLSNEV